MDYLPQRYISHSGKQKTRCGYRQLHVLYNWKHDIINDGINAVWHIRKFHFCSTFILTGFTAKGHSVFTTLCACLLVTKWERAKWKSISRGDEGRRTMILGFLRLSNLYPHSCDEAGLPSSIIEMHEKRIHRQADGPTAASSVLFVSILAWLSSLSSSSHGSWICEIYSVSKLNKETECFLMNLPLTNSSK